MMSAQSHEYSEATEIPAPSLLVFHKLLERFSFGASNFSPGRFRRLLEALVRSGWTLTQTANRPEGRAVTISFDDGYAHLADLLPGLMDRYRFAPVIFVPSDLIGKSNAWDYSYRFCPTPHIDADTLRSLADRGVVIASHAVSHCDLTRCSDSRLRSEMSASRRHLEDITGKAVNWISYPFGRVTERVTEAAREAGYTRGFTMSLPRDSDDPMATGRVPVYGFDTNWSVLQKLEHGAYHSIERFKGWTVGRLSGGTELLNRLRRRSF